MADSGTIARISGLLKPTFAEGVREQQQLNVDMRKLIGKPAADAWKAPGQYFEISARISGNRAGIMPAASDDALPVASRQKEVKFQVVDRGYQGRIQMYEKDILNTDEGSFQSYMSHKTDEVKGITNDYNKVVNIDLSAGDGSGVLSLVNAAATASNTITLQVGINPFQYGSLYLVQNDLIDIYDPTLTTSRTNGAGVTVLSITKSTGGGASTITVSAAITVQANDVVVRGSGRVNKSYIGLLGMLRNQGVTFQNLSTTTYPILQANRINMNGAPLTETTFQTMMDTVLRNAGTELTEFWCGPAQWAAYLASGTSQKRFMESTMDKGFETLKYAGKLVRKFIDIPPSVVMAGDTNEVKFGELVPWGPSEMDGSILKWVPGYAAYTAYYREYGNMVYYRPNTWVLADNLAFNTSNNAYVF